MRTSKTSLGSLAGAFVLCVWTSLRAEITLQLPQAPIEQGQPFQITFEVTGAGAAQPDLAPLALH